MIQPSNFTAPDISCVQQLTFNDRFIDSEADLDAAIKTLLPMAQAASISYPEFISSGATATLTGLLSHENLDIVMDTVEVIKEFTDDDIEEEQELDQYGRTRNREEALGGLVNTMVYCVKSIYIVNSPDNVRLNILSWNCFPIIYRGSAKKRSLIDKGCTMC
jgi:hypothetical protein